jgi:glutathione synthase/RimK-type ligase-like ATP-grasp enzyme
MSSKPILVIGSPRDPTSAHTVAALQRQNRRFEVLDLDRFCRGGSIEGRLDDPSTLVVRDAGDIVRFDRFGSCYARFIDAPFDREEDGGVAWGRYRMMQIAVSALKMLVVNRPSAGGSNDSKPYQTSLIERHGFRVPRSCSTNFEKAAAEFVASCPGGAIYKSNSGERSIVQAVTTEDIARLSLLATCPVFFQERIWGDDVRVHVVCDRCHGVIIRSPAVDYRYDRSGEATEEPFVVPTDLADRGISITAAFGLVFSGIDFVRSQENGEFYCLEVNPMPGYHGYDLALNGEISESLGELLASA